MIGIIAGVSANGVIGVDGTIPWNYPEDMKHFRKTTTDSIVIMGRKTFDSIGRALPKRRNIIVSQTWDHKKYNPENTEVVNSITSALEICQGDTRDIWFIGGSSIYEEAMVYADKIVLTQVPDYIKKPDLIKFPWINPRVFSYENSVVLSENPTLYIISYKKIVI